LIGEGDSPASPEINSNLSPTPLREALVNFTEWYYSKKPEGREFKGRLGYVSSFRCLLTIYSTTGFYRLLIQSRTFHPVLFHIQACLNTYLRTSVPPIFCSRTLRLASLQSLGVPNSPAPLARLQSLCHQNSIDLLKTLKWNERFNIRFFRISSELFPFYSHKVWGNYDVGEPTRKVLEECGKWVMEKGHRVTMHPGQFNQLASPNESIVENTIRDLDYHLKIFELLKLSGQTDRDAVMILHMGGTYGGDKPAVYARFKQVYSNLSQGIKARLVLENDDVSYTISDLLPLCEELNIPLVLDWHHHNVLPGPLIAGSDSVVPLLPRIKQTWIRRGIKPKQHLSCARLPWRFAPNAMSLRGHSDRIAFIGCGKGNGDGMEQGGMPPCEDDVDLMIEAKDKEQAVLELGRGLGMKGFEEGTFGEVIMYVREDVNRLKKRKIKKKAGVKEGEGEEGEVVEYIEPIIPEDEVGMGGPEGRVFWPEGCEDWLKPKKRERKIKPKEEMAEQEGEEEETVSPKKRVASKKSTKPKKSMTPKKSPPKKAASKKRKLESEDESEEDTWQDEEEEEEHEGSESEEVIPEKKIRTPRLANQTSASNNPRKKRKLADQDDDKWEPEATHQPELKVHKVGKAWRKKRQF
jgi:UV DNA damage endonuclease